jgi:hypothetical protein
MDDKRKRPTSLVNDDPFAAVRMENIQREGVRTDKYYVAIQKPDSEEFTDIPGVGAVHSEDYQLVTNQAVHDLALEVISTTGMDFRHVPSFGEGHSQPIMWNGHRFCERWFTEDVKVDAPGAGGGHFALGLQVENSYGGSSSVSFSFFGMYLLCSNQFHSGNLFSAERFPHVSASKGGDLHADLEWAKSRLVAQAETFGKIQPQLDLLAETRVEGVRGFLDLRRRMHAETGVNTRDRMWLDELSGQGISNTLELPHDTYGEVESYWALSNAYTALTTHAVGGIQGAAQSSRVVDWMLDDAKRLKEAA